jgi:hypothetical protein
MSDAIKGAGINADEEATTAALDAISALVADAMRDRLTGGICDQAIGKYGPGGLEAPDFVTIRLEPRVDGNPEPGEAAGPAGSSAMNGEAPDTQR